jgi:hypothetical protein
MILHGAKTSRTLTVTLALLVFTAGIPMFMHTARADTPGTLDHPVTATPPVQVVPATTVSKNVQQRMRGCNAAADAKKLAPASRETFIKSCMARHAISRPSSQAKTNP